MASGSELALYAASRHLAKRQNSGRRRLSPSPCACQAEEDEFPSRRAHLGMCSEVVLQLPIESKGADRLERGERHVVRLRTLFKAQEPARMEDHGSISEASAYLIILASEVMLGVHILPPVRRNAMADLYRMHHPIGRKEVIVLGSISSGRAELGPMRKKTPSMSAGRFPCTIWTGTPSASVSSETGAQLPLNMGWRMASALSSGV
eukprot:CAMPEP_0180705226 /NCGR_PEP_ID=MMETSP1038_2-20121128/7567_1 /TAXON_ID=632150 /ORGANISM="Azadinium spinosum, Strain 3D9" /LENGTH=205 /DNA_ID=CAMNT_0022737093 /DNA_START=730 /DNA_END=1346 /DNA_ORIENTATION=-